MLKKSLFVLMLIMSAVILASCGRQSSVKIAEGVVDSMSKGDFAAATSNFSATMKSQLPSDKLQLLWQQLTTQIGSFKGCKTSREAEEQGMKVVYVTCQFEKTNLDVKIVFDTDKHISGFYLVPSEPSRGSK